VKEGERKLRGKSRQISSYCWLILIGNEQTQTAGWRTNLCDIGYTINGALVLLVVFGTSEGIRHARRAAEDGSVRGGANVEFGERIEVDLDLVRGVALALTLDLAGLEKKCVSYKICDDNPTVVQSYLLEELG